MKKRTSSTAGINAQIFVAKAINYTTDADLATFLANAPVGEIGVFDANDARHTDAIGSSESFYFAMRTSIGIKRTPLYKKSDILAWKKAYTAPVAQTSHVGWNRTGGSLNLDTIVAGQNYMVRIIETTEGFEPYPTWQYEYTAKPNDTQMEILLAIAKKMNDDNIPEHKQNQRLVQAKVVADATYGDYALTGTTPTLTVTNGSIYAQIESAANDGASDIAVGDYIAFDAAAAPSDSIGDIYKVKAIAAGNDAQITLDRPYLGATQTFTEAEAEGTRVKKVTVVVDAGLEISTIDDNTHFRIALGDYLVNADISYTTAYTRSNGTYDQIRALEIEGETFEGDTAKNVEFAANFGQQDIFSVAGETYDTYHIQFVKSESGIAPKVQQFHRGYVVIAVAKSAGDVDSTLDTLFGL